MVKQENNPSFFELIEKCMNGERLAQKKLYTDHYSFAMAICQRYCKTKDEALEVLNDGFLKVFKNLHKYNTSQSFRNWLKRILINASIDFYRSQKKHYFHQDIDTAISISDHQESAVQKLNADELIHVINTLPETFRINFNLFAIDGFSHLEIAKLMNISEGTSKSNVSRAREMLRKKLAKMSEEYIRRKI